MASDDSAKDEIAEDDEDDDLEPTPADLEDPASATPAVDEDVESLQELLEKQESESEADEAGDDGDEAVPAAPAARDERLEPTDSRVVPIQATEFTCKRCFLVRHRSQLADKKKMLCRDCV